MQDHWLCYVDSDAWCAQPDIWIEISRPGVNTGTFTFRCPGEVALVYEWAGVLQWLNNPNNGFIYIRFFVPHLLTTCWTFWLISMYDTILVGKSNNTACTVVSCHITIHIGRTQVKTLHIATKSISVKVQTSFCVLAYSECLSHVQHYHTPPMF